MASQSTGPEPPLGRVGEGWRAQEPDLRAWSHQTQVCNALLPQEAPNPTLLGTPEGMAQTGYTPVLHLWQGGEEYEGEHVPHLKCFMQCECLMGLQGAWDMHQTYDLS